jgi:hypothetical protein
VSSVSNGLYFRTLLLVSVMHVIYPSKGMSKKFGVCVIYRKIRSFIFCRMKHSGMFYSERVSLLWVGAVFELVRSLVQGLCSLCYFVTLQAILVYWASSNFISLLQVGFLQIPSVRDFFKIQKMVSHSPDSLPVKPKGFMEGIRECK